jgi:hypothetical protein
LGNWHQKWVNIGNWKQTRPRNGRLFELGNNWEQQLRPRSGRFLEFKQLL